jgi:hypothetical protein
MFILQCQKVSNNRQILLQRAETGIVLIVFKKNSYYVRATIFLKDKQFKKTPSFILVSKTRANKFNICRQYCKFKTLFEICIVVALYL